MKRKIIYFALLFLLLSGITAAQGKLAYFGVGYNFKSDVRAFDFNISFNRIPAVEATDGPFIAVFTNTDKTIIYAVRPSFEANVGKDAASSPNNILGDIALEMQRPNTFFHTGILIGEISVRLNSDKDMESGLLYSNAGIKFLYYNYPAESRFYILPALNFHYGSIIASAGTPQYFTHIMPSVYTEVSPLEALTIGVKAQMYIINGNNSAVADGTYGNFMVNLSYKFTKQFSIAVKYTVGQYEPKFVKLNNISIGLSISR